MNSKNSNIRLKDVLCLFNRFSVDDIENSLVNVFLDNNNLKTCNSFLLEFVKNRNDKIVNYMQEYLKNKNVQLNLKNLERIFLPSHKTIPVKNAINMKKVNVWNIAISIGTSNMNSFDVPIVSTSGSIIFSAPIAPTIADQTRIRSLLLNLTPFFISARPHIQDILRICIGL